MAAGEKPAEDPPRSGWVAAKYSLGDGEPVAASGLRMTPRDLARTGQLVLDAGVASGRQMVPAEWLHSASCRA